MKIFFYGIYVIWNKKIILLVLQAKKSIISPKPHHFATFPVEPMYFFAINTRKLKAPVFVSILHLHPSPPQFSQVATVCIRISLSMLTGIGKRKMDHEFHTFTEV